MYKKLVLLTLAILFVTAAAYASDPCDRKADGKCYINVELEIPQAIIDGGGIRSFALANGWKEKVVHLDEAGKPVIVDGKVEYIDNPLTALAFCKAAIRTAVKNDYKKLVEKKTAEAAKAQFEALFQ